MLRDRLGPLRRHGPHPDPADLGRIDVVLVSHAHPDHFDRSSLRALDGSPVVIVPRGLGGRVRRATPNVREIVVGESAALAPGWSVEAVAARHWRWPVAPAVATIGYVVTGPDGRGIYFPGDTSRFAGMRRLAGRVDLALLPVGRWGPHGGPGHLSPRTAAEVAADVGARIALPIHWGTFYPRGLRAGPRLTDPPIRFRSWAERLAPDLEILLLEPGGFGRVEL